MPQESTAASPPSVYNVANLLTVLRLLLVPAFLVVAVESHFTDTSWRMIACGVFLLAAFTDFVDGWLARRHDLVTAFGKIADPIADKALTGAALVLLSLWDRLPWWVTVVILVREFGITALRFWVIRLGVIAASHGGKIKTVLQVTAIAWYLWPWPSGWDAVGPWLMGAATIVTVGTGVDYIVRVIAMRRRAARE